MTASITFNGKKSSDFGLILINEMSHTVSSNDVETIVVPGRDGVLLKDNKRLKEIEMAFPFVMKHRNLTVAQENVSEWLMVKGFHDLTLSWDRQHVYKASVIEGFDIKEVLRTFGKCRVSFLVHPVKYRLDGLNTTTVTKRQNLTNPTKRKAKPLVTISGNGSGTLTINGRQTKFVNMQGGIVIDTQQNLVYYQGLSVWDKVERTPQSKMPYLDSGANVIDWSGGITHVTIKPYWEVRI